MKQVIEWKKIDDENMPPHREHCYFLKDNSPYPELGDIVTGHYQRYDGKWVIVDPMQELTFKIPLYEFTHYAEVE